MAREPSTGSTSMPPETATYARSPQVAAPTSTRAPAGTATAVPQSRARPSTVTGTCGAGDRDGHRRRVPGTRPGRRGTPGWRPTRVADQAVGQPVGRAVEGSRARDAEVGQTRAAEVLDGDLRPGVDDPSSRGSPIDEPHPGPGRQQGRRLALDVPQRRRRCARSAASPGRGARVDTGERPGEPHRPGGHLGPRLLEPRHLSSSGSPVR